MTRANQNLHNNKSHEIAARLRRHLAEMQPAIGAWATVPHPTIVELMATLGFDFLLIDGEHSSIEPSDLAALLPAAELRSTPTIFRSRSQLMPPIKAALDAGVSGVMVPMIESAVEAQAVVNLCRYAPMGRRGIGPWRASSYYDNFADYLEQANNTTTVALQIESSTGLTSVEEIAKVNGFDVLFAGPMDLASSLGLPLGDMGPVMLSALERIANAARKSGKIAGIDLQDTSAIPTLTQLGYSFFTVGSDIGFIQQAGRDLTDAVKGSLGRADK